MNILKLIHCAIININIITGLEVWGSSNLTVRATNRMIFISGFILKKILALEAKDTLL